MITITIDRDQRCCFNDQDWVNDDSNVGDDNNDDQAFYPADLGPADLLSPADLSPAAPLDP